MPEGIIDYLTWKNGTPLFVVLCDIAVKHNELVSTSTFEMKWVQCQERDSNGLLFVDIMTPYISNSDADTIYRQLLDQE